MGVRDVQSSLVSLCDANLAQLPAPILRPNYDRSKLRSGIVHIGVGNFHRAHQAWYLHRLMQNGAATDWAIIGAGVRPYDAKMRDLLRAQDCLTTLIELTPDRTSAEVIGSMIDYLPIEEGNASLIAQLAHPDIRIVTLTITEGGYYFDPLEGGFDTNHADIQHDAAHPDEPRTVFGAIVAALARRRSSGNGPFTVQSCDNLAGNGDVTRQSVVSLARLTDPDLADWISDTCTFPNSMVDCIVPATGPEERAMARRLGIDDHAPVTHESYRQWVIEDRFCAGRPDWENAGAILTNDVHAYEAMKIRILNAGHQILAGAGELLAVATIADCMAHPGISALFHKVVKEEIIPYVAPVPGLDPTAYAELISARFSNPEIRDTTRRVAFDGSSRHPGFLLPILRDALAKGGSVDGLALVEAIWARMCAGQREDGSEIAANDPIWAQLSRAAMESREAPHVWLAQGNIYGELNTPSPFTERFCDWLRLIWDKGTSAAIAEYIGQD